MDNLNKQDTLMYLQNEKLRLTHVALKLIEKEARKLMSKHAKPTEFIMAMGSAFFTDKQGQPMAKWDYQYLQEFFDLVDDLDNDFHLTGMPIRFTETGEIQTDW